MAHLWAIGGGGIIHTAQGVPMAGFVIAFGFKTNLEAESLASEAGLRLCCDNEWLNAYIDTASLVLCKMMREHITVPWRLDFFILKLRTLLSVGYFQISRVREVNSLADNLAKAASSSHGFHLKFALHFLTLFVVRPSKWVTLDTIQFSISKEGIAACQGDWSKPVESNAATSSQKVNEPNEDWDVQVSFAVEECIFCCTTDQKDELALTTVNINPINYNVDWIIDSGCSNHMTGDKRKLPNLKEYKGGRVVVTTDNSRPDEIKVYQNKKITGTPIMQEKWMETVYVMSTQEAYVDKARKNETPDLRIGHVSYHKLKIMMMKSMLKGLPQLDVRDDNVCADHFRSKFDKKAV
ncbi:hypothetical protein ACH5RR_000716 [Cinchona calisaya]|uniref:Retrovirus-related Pol polyprotein from transposon TNT 1-94-like beta-barrel domain-containing protein n=1 Tax=Cinchona calisaya TaxID=153742 RepID=A0ABD3B1X6_9GENT